MSKVADLHEELRQAQHELAIAQHNFDRADPDHVDIAIYELQAAELRIGVVLRELKGV